MKMDRQRFNRDIVECKVVKGKVVNKPILGFNRDIVECKGAVLHFLTVFVCDLIETLWNVKYGNGKLPPYSKIGFNRDIVECKGPGRTCKRSVAARI